MEFFTKLDTKNNVRMHQIVGFINKEQALQVLSEVYSSTEFSPDMNVMWDFSNTDLTSFSLDDTDDVADYIVNIRSSLPEIKSAIVVSEVLGKYLADKLAKKVTEDGSIDLKIFKQKEDALLWLRVSAE